MAEHSSNMSTATDSYAETHTPSQQMSSARLIKNLWSLCLGFPLMFCAYKGLANLQSTMNKEKGVGVISQSIIYMGFIISSIFLPKMFIRKFGCKCTLVLAILAYCPYIAANIYPHFEAIAPTAFLLGLAAGPLWSAQSVYLTELGNRYAASANQNADVTVSLYFGIFFTLYGTSDIWGNLVSYYVLKPSNEESYHKTNITQKLMSCGIEFCSSEASHNHNLEPPSDTKRYLLTGIYLSCAVFAALIIAFFLDPLKENLPGEEKKDPESWLSLAFATLKRLKNSDQLLLVPLTAFSGTERAYFLSEFTMAYIACAWGIYHVGYVFVCYGAVDAAASIAAGRALKYLPRHVIMATACAGNVTAVAIMFLWTPNPDEFHMFFALAALWGFSDAVWHTQIRAYYSFLFKGEEAGAFANFLLWESVGFFIVFVISKYLCMKAKASLVLCILAVGMICYGITEIRKGLQRQRSYSLKVQEISVDSCSGAESYKKRVAVLNSVVPCTKISELSNANSCPENS